jgi:hypothetical protein
MRWANCFTASEVPRSLASRPNSTSALPPLAAFAMNFWSAGAILVSTAPPLEVSEREVWALPYSGRPSPISGECPHYNRSISSLCRRPSARLEPTKTSIRARGQRPEGSLTPRLHRLPAHLATARRSLPSSTGCHTGLLRRVLRAHRRTRRRRPARRGGGRSGGPISGRTCSRADTRTARTGRRPAAWSGARRSSRARRPGARSTTRRSSACCARASTCPAACACPSSGLRGCKSRGQTYDRDQEREK